MLVRLIVEGSFYDFELGVMNSDLFSCNLQMKIDVSNN
jgi:hypothetical protein